MKFLTPCWHVINSSNAESIACNLLILRANLLVQEALRLLCCLYHSYFFFTSLPGLCDFRRFQNVAFLPPTVWDYPPNWSSSWSPTGNIIIQCQVFKAYKTGTKAFFGISLFQINLQTINISTHEMVKLVSWPHSAGLARSGVLTASQQFLKHGCWTALTLTRLNGSKWLRPASRICLECQNVLFHGLCAWDFGFGVSHYIPLSNIHACCHLNCV